MNTRWQHIHIETHTKSHIEQPKIKPHIHKDLNSKNLQSYIQKNEKSEKNNEWKNLHNKM